MLESLRQPTDAPGLFEAFGLGAIVVAHFAYLVYTIGGWPLNVGELDVVVQSATQIVLLLTTVFVFVAYALGRTMISLGGSQHRIISKAWKKDITPAHRYLMALELPDRKWAEYQRRQRELSFEEGLFATLMFLGIMQSATVVGLFLRDGTQMGLVGGAFTAFLLLSLSAMSYVRSEQVVGQVDLILASDKPNPTD